MSKKNPTVFFPGPKRAVIEELEIPCPKEGEVLIKTSRTMISIGTEMTAFCGDFPEGSSWEKFFSCPYYPGYNNIGTIVETGTGIDKSVLGRRVASYGRHAMYVAVPFHEIITQGEESGEQHARGSGACHEVPDNVHSDHAVFFTIPQIVMNGIRAANIQWGEAAVVYGTGLLGQFAVRFCRKCGASPVFAVDVSINRLKFLPEDPGVICLNPLETDISSAIRNNNHGRMADIVFEVTGDSTLIEKELSLLREKGRLVILSSLKKKTAFDFHDFCVWPSLSIIGCHNFSHPLYAQCGNPWTKTRHIELFFDLLSRHEMNMDTLISRNVFYKNAPEVYTDLLNNRSNDMGIIINWDAIK